MKNETKYQAESKPMVDTSPSKVVSISKPPDPEVPEKKPRRRFTTAYKLRILKAYDSCAAPGEIGAFLRREGLYHSNINTWLRQRDEGVLHGLSPKKRGRKAREVNPLAKEVARLERDNKKLSEKLKQAETIIEVQKKISEILGIPQNNNGETS
jgi:transposase-like protein